MIILTVIVLSQNLEEQKELLQGAESSKHRTDMKSKIKENQNTELGLHKSLKELTSNKQELSTSLSALVDEFNSLEKQIVDLDYIEEDEDKDAIV
jgi:septal ring factor EnvC (AmiA/AmiB activator)